MRRFLGTLLAISREKRDLEESWLVGEPDDSLMCRIPVLLRSLPAVVAAG